MHRIYLSVLLMSFMLLFGLITTQCGGDDCSCPDSCETNYVCDKDASCTCVLDAKPEPGKAALAIKAEFGTLEVAPEDKVGWAILAELKIPPEPTKSAWFTKEQIEKPMWMIDKSVEPGDYYVTSCLDVGGDSPLCMGDDRDKAVIYPSMAEMQTITFEAGKTVKVQANLEAGTGELITD